MPDAKMHPTKHLSSPEFFDSLHPSTTLTHRELDCRQLRPHDVITANEAEPVHMTRFKKRRQNSILATLASGSLPKSLPRNAKSNPKRYRKCPSAEIMPYQQSGLD